MNRQIKLISLVLFSCLLGFSHTIYAAAAETSGNGVRIKDMARIQGVRENSLIGYGLVVGLAGTGDSSRNKATQQSIMNVLTNFGISVSQKDIRARNAAIALVTSELPAFSQPGDQLDIVVSSMGDARSLVGGTLLLTPLKAANDQTYALAQGQVSVGGYKFDLNGNIVQKNHPAVGMVSNGAKVEKRVPTELVAADNTISILLNDADFTTAHRIETAIETMIGNGIAEAVSPSRVIVQTPDNMKSVIPFIARLENIKILPDRIAKIVVNERTGTIVAGGDVTIANVTISHENIKVNIRSDFAVSQPSFVQTINSPNVSTVVVPQTEIEVKESGSPADTVSLPASTSVSDLVAALKQIKTSTRDVIVIIQAIKAAGALHAELVIQ